MLRERSLEVYGGGFVRGSRSIDLTPSYGGELGLRAGTELGRRTDVGLAQRVATDPFFRLGPFDSLQPAVGDPGAEVPVSSPTSLYTETRSLALGT